MKFYLEFVRRQKTDPTGLDFTKSVGGIHIDAFKIPWETVRL